MKLDKYTQKSQAAILQAQELARELNHQSIEPSHLLLTLLRQEEGIVPAILTNIAGSVQAERIASAGDVPRAMNRGLTDPLGAWRRRVRQP